MSHAVWHHPRWTGPSREFWQNLVHWRREWQNTSVFFPWEPHEQYEQYNHHQLLIPKHFHYLKKKHTFITNHSPLLSPPAAVNNYCFLFLCISLFLIFHINKFTPNVILCDLFLWLNVMCSKVHPCWSMNLYSYLSRVEKYLIVCIFCLSFTQVSGYMSCFHILAVI